MLEKHVGAVLGEKEKCQVEVAEEHASVVKAVLDAAITYAGWAHVVDLGKHGLIKGYAIDKVETGCYMVNTQC